MEENGLFCREQAGFRAQEECPGQATALVEMVHRRVCIGIPTCLMFVDLSKAYDTVPHEALFGKMYQLGIRGRMLEFVKALYASSTVAVQMGGYTSDPFPLLRGLRQGCPFSRVLFDIFDNGWLGKPGKPRYGCGVEVPGVRRDKEGLMALVYYLRMTWRGTGTPCKGCII